MLDIQDILEFLADVHTLSKVKSNVKGLTVGLNEDTLGGILKSSLAQFVALEITKGNGRENRSANRFLPWLFNPPANTAAQVGKASMIWLKCQSLGPTLMCGYFGAKKFLTLLSDIQEIEIQSLLLSNPCALFCSWQIHLSK